MEPPGEVEGRRYKGEDSDTPPEKDEEPDAEKARMARSRMARLAEWPLGVVVHVMSGLRRPERAALAGAVPAWQEAALALRGSRKL